MKRFNITILGKVQGVGFRFSAMQKAYQFGICGSVKNDGPGRVFIEAEGEQSGLDAFIAWCRKGPIGATVEQVVLEEVPLQHHKGFEIIHRTTL